MKPTTKILEEALQQYQKKVVAPGGMSRQVFVHATASGLWGDIFRVYPTPRRFNLIGYDTMTAVEATAVALEYVRDRGLSLEDNLRMAGAFGHPFTIPAANWLVAEPQRVLFYERHVLPAGVMAIACSIPGIGSTDSATLATNILKSSLFVADFAGVANPADVAISQDQMFAEESAWEPYAAESNEILLVLDSVSRWDRCATSILSTTSLGPREVWLRLATLGLFWKRLDATHRITLIESLHSEDAVLPWLRQSPEEVQRAAQLDMLRGPTAYKSVFARPLVASGNKMCVSWPRALEEKALPGRLFPILDDMICADPGNTMRIDDIHSAYGAANEARVRALLSPERLTPGTTIITEDELRSRFPGSSVADLVLLEQRHALIVEARHRVASHRAQAAVSPAALDRDLNLAVLNKLHQCDATIANLKMAGDIGGRLPVAVIVNSSAFPVNMFIQARVWRRAATLPYWAEAPYPIVTMNTTDIRLLLNIAAAHGKSIGDLLAAWHKDEPIMDLTNWLVTHYNIAPTSEDTAWFADATLSIFSLPV